MNQASENKNWPGLKVKHAIEAAGFTQRDIAKISRKSYQAVHAVIWRDLHCIAVERAIADVLGPAPAVIWPSRYPKKAAA